MNKTSSISRKAIEADGRRRCSNCPAFNGVCCRDELTMDVCSLSFRTGYVKGYQQRIKEEKHDDNIH